MNKKAIFGDFSEMKSTEVMAYRAFESDGYHMGDVIDFEEAVDTCTRTLEDMQEEIYRRARHVIALLRGGCDSNNADVENFIQEIK